MYKIKTSKSDVKNASYRILAVGYCEAQYLLKAESPVCYCSGVYGWCCDNYDLQRYGYNLTISTGYSPISDQNIAKRVIKNKYEIIEKYEKKARKICQSANGWDKMKKQLENNLKRFIEEVAVSE